jgi:hypothetical protein
MSTMNIPDSLPSSFHDANQDSSPASGLNATPASAATVSTPGEDTPVGQRCLFAEASTRESDNNGKELEDSCQRNGAWLLGRIQNESLDIDMALVKIEAGEDGDGDSHCSADKAGEMFSSVLELASDGREIVILEEKEDMLCDSPHNMIEVKRGLAPEVKVSSPPADWVPASNLNAPNQRLVLLLITLVGGDNTRSTCGHGGFGEAGSGLLAWQMNKPGITFGMQTVLEVAVLRSKRNLLRIQSPQRLHQLYSTSSMVCLSRSSTMGLNPYAVYYQVALNIVDCQ